LIEITENIISIDEVINSVRQPEAGAVVIFIGTVRSEPGIDGLELESYKEMALEKLQEIRNMALNKYSILEVSLIHRTGTIAISEDIVTIAVSAAHRADAFSACRFIIDELKVSAPIWKKELGPGTWVQGEQPKMDEANSGKISGMVDISDKDITKRTALAEGYITLSKASIDAIKSHGVKKGDVFEVAKIAAVNGVKQTPIIIPHCHQIPITGIDVDFEILENDIKVTCQVKADYKTGVEMDALTGVSCALLTIWDMVKYLEKDPSGQYPTTIIHDVNVISKIKE
jgi:cyclic pyranopterin phosphate synthase